ncbi:MAG: phenylalanine--tRNA ligase subunit beta [SAR324 cluster bacterium]
MALRVPYSWLKDYVPLSVTAAQLAERLTLAGLEVESVTAIGAEWDADKVFVGQVLKLEKHPNADRLCLATVDYGKGRPLTVVTGAPNLLDRVGKPLPAQPLKVALATVGANLIDGHADDGRRLKLKAGNIRGVRSEGMVCSEKELGLSAEHEGILLLPADAPAGQPLLQYLGDHVLEFDIKGGFAHLLCVLGIARETAALTGQPLDRSALQAGLAGNPHITDEPGFVKLAIEDPAICSRFVAVLVEGIVNRPSPFWMRQRLIRAGMRPINAIVDATNYVMLELGQPLHAFDYDALRPERGGEIPTVRVRRAKPGERMTTLDGAERLLDPQMVLVTDGHGPVSLAGIMGGQASEVKDTTTRVLLEAANWDFLVTRRTSQVLKLRSEAADRFGKRLSPELCLPAALRCATLIAELCGGRLYVKDGRPEYGDLYPRPVPRVPIALPLDFVTRLLGVAIAREEVVRILKALEFSVAGADPLQVTPPSHRMDVSLPADLAEEVGRIYGYDRMPRTLIRDELPPQRQQRLLDGTERVRDLLAGCGLDEIITYSIISLADEAKLHPDRAVVDPARYLSVRNPLDAERAHLRRNLLTGALNTARANLRFGARVATFETGCVFYPRPGQTLPDEPRRLCAVLTGPRQPATWNAGGAGSAEPPVSFDFFDIKGVAEALLAGMAIDKVEWRPGEDPAYHPGRRAEVRTDGRLLGVLGELHPRVAAAFDLPDRAVCALEFDLDALLALWRDNRQMQPVSAHPPIYEDLAFVVDGGLQAETVRALIEQTGRPLLRDVRLFDLYRDDKLGAGKKSLAYALTYQADDRTLTDAEVAKVREKIVRRAAEELGAVLRA